MPAWSVADLAGRLGLHRTRGGFRGACPACAYHDAFSLRPGKGDRLGLFCASCGDRDAITDAVMRAVGGAWTPPVAAAASDDAAARRRKQDAARRLWSGSAPAPGTIVETYLLAARSLPGLAASATLRFRGDCHHPGGGSLPAMVALVQDVTGAPIAAHRTFLLRDGSGKAKAEPQRATLGSPWGGAVRLDPIAEQIVVGEGIETAASAGRLLGLPAWAAISALTHPLIPDLEA